MKRFFIGVLGGVIVVAGAYFFGGDLIKNILTTGNKTEETTPSPSGDAFRTDQPIATPKSLSGTQKTQDYVLLAKYVVPERPHATAEPWTEIILYSDGIFRTIVPPDNVDRLTSPVTDGTSIYFLIDNKNIRDHGRSLVAIGIEDNKQTVVSDSTPLVEPRAVFASNDGKTIAYYLDGTQKQMTELWTYSTEKTRKRVSVERLTQQSVGPFWDANGGFLVRDGEKVLRGSPNRTGADTLQIKTDWKNILAGQSILPSPGGTQVVYLIGKKEGKNMSASLRVWDLKEGSEREIARFDTDKVVILGWSKVGSLVVREGESDVKIWNIAKDAKENYGLPVNAHSAILAGDGSAISYILPTDGGEKLVFATTKTGKATTQENIPVDTIVTDATETTKTEILQFLRKNVVIDGYSQAPEFPLAKEEIIGYIMGHIREIAAVSQNETAVAQRVWFTSVSGAVYVDYLVGKTTWRRLVQVDGAGGQASKFTLIGVYAPVAGEWVLAKGRDLADPKTTELYEYDPGLDKWLKKVITNLQP